MALAFFSSSSSFFLCKNRKSVGRLRLIVDGKCQCDKRFTSVRRIEVRNLKIVLDV